MAEGEVRFLFSGLSRSGRLWRWRSCFHLDTVVIVFGFGFHFFRLACIFIGNLFMYDFPSVVVGFWYFCCECVSYGEACSIFGCLVILPVAVSTKFGRVEFLSFSFVITLFLLPHSFSVKGELLLFHFLRSSIEREGWNRGFWWVSITCLLLSARNSDTVKSSRLDGLERDTNESQIPSLRGEEGTKDVRERVYVLENGFQTSLVNDGSPCSFVASSHYRPHHHYRPHQSVMAVPVVLIQAPSLLDGNPVPRGCHCPPLSKSSYLKFHGAI
ncbi:hypothetical protein V8G54_017950 [Vigna mungo]|uniref:Transmembrane protein n=1 Tax=Vigna mungo TaxID=3915 RepID=A0AAQ3N7N8_VIGMU